MKILSVASEIFPLIKTGGLADVAGALPGALARENIVARTLIPGYPQITSRLRNAETAMAYKNLFGGEARVLSTVLDGLDLFILDAPHLYDRPGNPYLGPNGLDWPDNAQRFAALSRVGADFGLGRLAGFIPSIIHAHDWQAAMAPAYMHYDGGPHAASVVTVHNLAFQGHYRREVFAQLGLPANAMSIEGVEYFDGVGFLKAGLQFADCITTVSPTYAQEIMTAEYGMALDGLLRRRADVVVGIVNGIDLSVWNPARDPFLAQTYNALNVDRRKRNKAHLQQRLGLAPNDAAPLFGVVSRLSSQKGLDLLLGALPDLVAKDAQLALLGSGEASLQDGFVAAAKANPAAVACTMGYDEALAHSIQAGADFILVPSRFEPCGLTQLCALRYGAVPVVARVGGLADTIIDANEAALSAGVATGIQFAPPEPEAFAQALERALRLYANAPLMRRLRLNGMRADVSWRGPAKRYAELYAAIAPGAKA